MREGLLVSGDLVFKVNWRSKHVYPYQNRHRKDNEVNGECPGF